MNSLYETESEVFKLCSFSLFVRVPFSRIFFFDFSPESGKNVEESPRSCLASGDFSCLLITFANSLDPDQD